MIAKKNSKHQGSQGGQGKHAPESRKPPQLREPKAKPVQEALAEANLLAQLRNSSYHRKRLEALKGDVLAVDANGKFKMSDAEFDKQVVKHVVGKLQQARDLGIMRGGAMRLPKTGKAIIVGDVHGQVPNLTAILKEAQLDKNPTTKLIFMGDMLAPSKEITPESVNIPANSVHRIISWLQARYPDQIFVINGNHEMHMMADAKKIEIPPDAPWSAYLGVVDARHFPDVNQVVNRIAESPLIIQIGDKDKGELTRTFQHSPGRAQGGHGLKQVEGMNTPKERYTEGMDIFDNENSLDAKAMKELNKRNKSDLTYFGHISPTTMQRSIADGRVKPIEAQGSVVKVDGGGVYIDSQTMRGGVLEINLDKDAVSEKIIPLAQLHDKHNTRQKGLTEFGGNDADIRLEPQIKS